MRTLPLFVLLSACKPEPGDPSWALDPIWLEPSPDGNGAEGAVHGFQTWELFAEEWTDRYARRHYVCGLVVELDGALLDPAGCEGCTTAWTLTTRLAETDCPEPQASDIAFLGLERLALGPPPVDASVDDPHPGTSTGAWADYGDGWVSYGWAWPEDGEAGTEASSTWDGERAWSFLPTWVWDL